MSAGGSIGMVLDRALNLDLLDVALRVGTEHGDAANARHLLTVALRDFVTPQEAENKTRKVLTRVWVVPPPPARAMIRWAIEHQREFPDRRALHYGALLATFPFVGSVSSAVGRQLHLDGRVDPRAIKHFARATFGEREFIDAGALKTLSTMRHLGLLEGPKGGPYVLGAQPSAPTATSGWFLHALVLTRQAESVGVGDLSRAHELATVKVEAPNGQYPLLEIHTEARGAVAVPCRPAHESLKAMRGDDDESPPQLELRLPSGSSARIDRPPGTTGRNSLQRVISSLSQVPRNLEE